MTEMTQLQDKHRIKSVLFGVFVSELIIRELGVNSNDFIKCLVKPKIKVGTEVVTQGRNKAQVGCIMII
jgi:hypothetical protein